MVRCSTAPSAARDARRRLELDAVALAVVDAERIAVEPGGARDREHGRRVEAAGEQHDGARARSPARLLAPQDLVQLQLEPHPQPVGENPLGELARVELAEARRKQHLERAARSCSAMKAPRHS